jgi:hypothetical protein
MFEGERFMIEKIVWKEEKNLLYIFMCVIHEHKSMCK